MFVEMMCACGATLQVDGADDTATWLWANRFTEAHTECGFMTPVMRDEQEKTTRYELKFKTKERINHDDEED